MDIVRQLPFARPDIGPEEIQRVVRCLESGWLTTGSESLLFERNFSLLMNGAECVAVNSATAAFALLFSALKMGPGDEVISSCWTFSSPVMEVWKTGATPVLVDVDRATLNIDVEDLARKITTGTKGIVVTHFAGLPAQMDGILALARRHKLWVIEDAAHALPAYYEGKLIGTLGSLATVFSFYATKTVTTGEGGMLVTADVGLANTCRRSRQHGFDRDLLTRYSTPEAPWEYEIAEVGSKANLGDVAAAIGVAQLAKVFSFAEKRRALAQQYLAGLADCVELPIVSTPNRTSANHLFVIRPTARSRDDLIAHLTNQGIGTSVHFKPLHLHKFYRDKLRTGENTCPVAAEEFKRVISLPIYTRMTGDDAQRVIDAVHEFVHGTGQRN